MKKASFYLLIGGLVGYLMGGGAQTGAQSPIGGDSAWSLEQFLVTKIDAVVKNTIRALNGEWHISADGVLYINQIVLAPQPLESLLPVEGALIFLENPVQIGMGYGNEWKFCQLIPEEEWGNNSITTDGDIAMYHDGRRWLARTDDLVIQ